MRVHRIPDTIFDFLFLVLALNFDIEPKKVAY